MNDNMKADPEKVEAARILEDEIYQINQNLKKAHLLISDMMQDYFGKYDPKKPEDVTAIRYGFKRNYLLQEIIFDLILKAKEQTDKLDELVKG